MTLAELVKQLRERAWTQSGSRSAGPDTRNLVSRLIDRATFSGSAPTQEQDALAEVLDALRVPARASVMRDNVLDQLSALIILELEALIDQIDRGLITASEISDALREARLHAVPPNR